MDDSPFRTFRVPQDRDCPPRWERNERLQWRYAYSRAAETRALNEVGQDCIVLDPAEDRLAFALCDGVSQSFYGDLAASHLGDALVEWLHGLAPTLGRPAFKAGLVSLLEELREEVTEEVDLFPLPKGLAPMLVDVLEQKRKLGSESMFVAGRLWLPGPECPQGQLLLAWLGDMRCRAWHGSTEVPFEGEFRTVDRWSSQRGPVAGPPQVHVGPLELSRLAIYSDGLAALDPLPQPPTDEELQAAIDASGRSPTSDDISWLDVTPAR